MKGIGASLITGLIIIAIVFLFVRPGSQGVSLVTSVGTALKNLFGSVTGGGTWGATTASK